MAIINVPAPRQADINPVLRFMIQMSSAREQKETRKLQERQIDIDEAALESRIGQATALARQADAIADQTYAETKAAYSDEALRVRLEGERSSALGDKADAKLKRQQVKNIKRESKVLESLRTSRPNEFKQMVLSARIADVAQAQIKGLNADLGNTRTLVQMGELQRKIDADAFDRKKPLYTLAGSFVDPVKQASAIAALDSDRMEEFTNIASLASEDVKAEKVEATALKQTTPVTQTAIDINLSEDTQYTPSTLAELKLAQDSGSAPPEVRIIRRPTGVDLQRRDLFGDPFKRTPFDLFGVGKGKDFIALSRNDAMRRGLLDEWNAAGPAKQPETTPEPSVRQGVKEGVRKTPVRSKSTKNTGVDAVTGAEKKSIPGAIQRDDGKVLMLNPQGDKVWIRSNQVDAAKGLKFKLVKE